MSYVSDAVRLRLEHHSEVAWPTTIITFDEVERHLRRLRRLPCGCFQYGGFTTRPTIGMYLADGSKPKVGVQRLMAMLSADRPLGPQDYACHACDNPTCANPDHIGIGTASSNFKDRLRPGRPIRERMAARFYDRILQNIAAAPPVVRSRKIGRPIGYRPDLEPRYERAVSLDTLPSFALREPCGKGRIALDAVVQHP